MILLLISFERHRRKIHSQLRFLSKKQNIARQNQRFFDFIIYFKITLTRHRYKFYCRSFFSEEIQRHLHH